jgi:hypothetical protein
MTEETCEESTERMTAGKNKQDLIKYSVYLAKLPKGAKNLSSILCACISPSSQGS